MDDLTQLADLNEKSILDVLNKRYQNDFIYTCIGDIIIATNPYKKLTLYGDEKKQEYKNLKGRDQHKPHIYIISDRAYQNLKCNQLNQCCVVSGESGAGKTESTKLLIEHIAFLCKHDSSNLNEQIIEVNPLLEAFGNAKTVINNNSSRFGKFIELVFDSNGQLEGAIISEYLLEKSRVVFHAPGEKNFHIFYYFFAGIDTRKQQANKLQAPEKHRIMADQESEKIYETAEKLNECKETWKKLLEVMMHIGFSSEEIDGIEALLTAIVHVADIKFMPHVETEGVFIEDDEAISLCAQLLQVNAETLVDSLIILKNKVGNEDIISLKNESQANDGRDALAKALYGRLFIWIVNRINHLLAPKPSIRNSNSNTWIGILDIYGFENFANNSFEQLCINIANEQLQLFFNEHIFRMELNEYEREGLNGCDVQFVDNKPLLDLFFKSKDPPCILAILDEESKFPQGSDQTFIDKLISNLSKKPEFQTTKGQSNFFTIMHFAGPVIYNVVGFLEKNRDTLSENILDCLGNSNSYIVHELFSPMAFVQKGINNTQRRKQFRMSKMITNFEIMRSTRINSEGQMKRASIICTPDRITTISGLGTMRGHKNSKTLATKFSDSLHGLIEKMFHAEPHFIRCIKPNSRKSSNQFNNEMVLAQLNYTGVLETVKIRKQGYSTRLVFPEFLHRYGVISGGFTSENIDGKHPEDICRKILKISKLDGWKIGHTKVFLKHYHVDNLNSVLSSVMESILGCQAFWRGTISRRKLAVLRARALVYREEIERMNLEMMDIGIKFYDALNHSFKKDQEVATDQVVFEPKSTNDHKIHPVNKPTVRIKGDKANLLLNKDRNSSQPHFPPLWEPVICTSQTDPSYVFLKESLTKLNLLQKDIWCKLYLMEKNAIIGKLYIRDANVILNDSEEKYTGRIIGINSKDFEHLNTEQSQDAIKKIGKGIQISKDGDGNVFITRLSDVEVHVIGGIDGTVSLDRSAAKVFDIEKFKDKVSSLLKTKDSQSGKINVNLIARWSVFNFSIGGIYGREVDLPLWISIINIHALDLIGDEKVLQEFFKKRKLSTTELNKIKEVWSQLNFSRSY